MTSEIQMDGIKVEMQPGANPSDGQPSDLVVANASKTVRHRLLAGRIARGVLGLLAIGSPAVDHAVNISQATAQEFSKQWPANTAEAAPEIVNYTEYSVEDLRAAGDNHIVGLVTLPDGQHIVSEEWDNAGTLSLKDRGKLSLFALGAIQSETDPDLRATVGKRGQMEDIGVLWLNGQTYEHGGGTIIDAQFDPENKFIITTEADPTTENQVVHYKFDLATKTFSKDPLSVVNGEVELKIQTPLRKTSTAGVYKTFGVIPMKWGYREITVDTVNNTLTTRILHEDEGYATGKLVNFIDVQGRERVWLINNWTDSSDWPNGSYGTLYDNVNSVPVIIQPKMSTDFTSGSVGLVAAAADKVGGVGYMAVANNGNRFLESFDLNNQLDLAKRGRIQLPGTSRGGGVTAVQVLTHGQDRYQVMGLRGSVAAVDNGIWMKQITGSGDELRKVPVLQVQQSQTRIYLPTVTKNHASGW